MVEDYMPNMKIETNDDGSLTLESEWSGNLDRVLVHPVQLRYLAEKMGLIKDVTASTGELTRDLDRMKRNMLRIREHAVGLRHNLVTSPEWENADLTFEMGQVDTLVDLLDMAVDDFVDNFVSTPPTPHQPADEKGSERVGDEQHHAPAARLESRPVVRLQSRVTRAEPRQLDIEEVS